ncbi:porin [Gayadomonas joobiniege]|uniref:porin n=1 Tax=Gayadomonas joobiniege TaxID=1234606 RepID=UPI000373346C|nr:porin [Gayadomonas joobiniege]
MLQFKPAFWCAVLVLPLSVLAESTSGQFYARIDLDAQLTDKQKETFSELKSNNSVIGLRGSHVLNQGITFFYNLEWRTNITADQGQDTFSERPQFIGLRGDFGRFTFGRDYTALRNTLVAGDLFNHYEADIGRLWQGENRFSEIITYLSPSWHGVAINFSYKAEESPEGESQNSLRIFYGDEGLRTSNWYAGLAHDFDVAGYTTTRSQIRHRIKQHFFSLAWQQEKNETSGEIQKGAFASYAYDLSPFTIESQLQSLDDTWIATIGGEYAASKSTDFYTWFSHKHIAEEADESYLAIGIQHRISVGY